jgi:peptidoglycan/LPS O-acetylase OafA/YrhL
MMIEIDRAYVAIALLWAVAGMLLGLYMGIASDTKLLTVHVAMMLSGFVTLALYGMVYRLWPALKKSPLAPAQFWITVVGVAALIVGSYFLVTTGSVPLAATASVAMIVGAALMCWLFISRGREAA